MYKYAIFTYCFAFAFCLASLAQSCRLEARFEENTARVILTWNMIAHSGKTSYLLLKSADTKTWLEVKSGKLLRYYTEEDLFEYHDKVSRDQKFYYRLKIIDADNKTISLSNIASINTIADKKSWVIYPNPVHDILSLVYQGENSIKGVINIIIMDFTGKIVIRFRAASTNKKLEIPVSHLPKGGYSLQISVLNEIVINEKFFRQ